MSYEMKDILKTMIDNNEPHWSADTMEMVRAELQHVYTQAEAFNSILKAYDEASSEGQMVYEFSNIIEKYESGESE